MAIENFQAATKYIYFINKSIKEITGDEKNGVRNKQAFEIEIRACCKLSFTGFVSDVTIKYIIFNCLKETTTNKRSCQNLLNSSSYCHKYKVINCRERQINR